MLLKIFLLQVNSSHNEILFIGILKCFTSWISIQAFDENILLSSPLLNHVLDILVNTQFFKIHTFLLFVFCFQNRNQHIVQMNYIKVHVIVYVIYLNYARYIDFKKATE